MSEIDATAAARTLLPTARFEWERVVRDSPMSTSTKCVAFILATYADRDGSRVRPGVEVLAAQASTSERTINRAMDTLRKAGFIDRIHQGNRWRNQADEYRLTLPAGHLFMPELTLSQRDTRASLDDTRVG